MKYRTIFPLAFLLTVVAVCFFCSDLPVDPASTTPSTPEVTLFPKDNYSVVDETGMKEIGLALQLPQQITSIRLSSSCEGADTVLSIQSDNPVADTIYLTRLFVKEGPCTLLARTTTVDPKFNNRVIELPLLVMANQNSTTGTGSGGEPTTNPTDNNGITDIPTDNQNTTTSLVPADIYAPENIFSGKADTLRFTANTAGGQTVSLVDPAALDPAVFTVVSSGPDAVLIAINPEAAAGSAQIGITVSDGNTTETLVYPVTLTDASTSLWNSTELPVEAIEGVEVQFDLNPYLTNPEAIITSDIGAIADGNIWLFTPPWGFEETGSAKITAKTAETSSVLTLNLTIPAGDVTPPVITTPETGANFPTSENQKTLTCTATDIESGIASVIMTYGDQTVKVVAENDTTFSGVISGLVHLQPVEVTITVVNVRLTRHSNFILV